MSSTYELTDKQHNILLVAVNSKYIHLSLAPWYLKAYCEDEFFGISILETTINDDINVVLNRIYNKNAKIVGFSCYIWNIEYIIKLASTLKKALPETIIVFGGPEVSYETRQLMTDNRFIDFVISGEGEKPFKNLLRKIVNDIGKYEDIKSLSFRDSGDIVQNAVDSPIENLDLIPSPYTDSMISNIKNKIVYFESSRGCPFSCTYCLSSVSKGVRYFSMNRVMSDLERCKHAGITQIKFVDRTFNCNKNMALQIFRFILENREATNCHFEIGADLLDQEILNLLEIMPAGWIQFEAGVQTTNTDVLRTIKRKTDLDKLYSNVKKIMEFGNIHLYLDLIAGLPGETYDSFKKSFNNVYLLKPHHLQLGFLKFLKGSQMRRDAKLYGCIYNDYPPYEIISNKDISADELMKLKRIEDLVERYYNSGRFTKSLKLILDWTKLMPFDFYEGFMNYWVKCGYNLRPLPLKQLYGVLIDYVCSIYDKDTDFITMLKQMLRYDYVCTEKGAVLADCLKQHRQSVTNNFISDFLRDKSNIEKYLPDYAGTNLQILRKHIHMEHFDYDVVNFGENQRLPMKKHCLVLFDYNRKHAVSGKYANQLI